MCAYEFLFRQYLHLFLREKDCKCSTALSSVSTYFSRCLLPDTLCCIHVAVSNVSACLLLAQDTWNTPRVATCSAWLLFVSCWVAADVHSNVASKNTCHVVWSFCNYHMLFFPCDLDDWKTICLILFCCTSAAHSQPWPESTSALTWPHAVVPGPNRLKCVAVAAAPGVFVTVWIDAVSCWMFPQIDGRSWRVMTSKMTSTFDVAASYHASTAQCFFFSTRSWVQNGQRYGFDKPTFNLFFSIQTETITG